MQARDYRVLHGFGGSAGQPGMLARELRRSGIEAESILMGGNKFGYDADHFYQDRSHENVRRVFIEMIPQFDIIHIHAITPFFTKRAFRLPMGVDLLAAKAKGKRVIVQFRGSEVRSPSAFAAASPYHYVTENPNGIFTTWNDVWVANYIKMCRALADEVLVIDPELQTYIPGARILPRSIDLSEWQHVGLLNDRRPLVVHAPSREAVKGTPAVVAAVEQLQSEGLEFDFQMVQGLPNTEARAIYEKADIILDQFRIGWYGVLAIEGMALGKCVVSYIRDDLRGYFADGLPPVAIANPETLKDTLRYLIEDPGLRRRQADRGHQFCVAHHDSRNVAGEAVKIYDDVFAAPKPIDIAAYMEVLAEQDPPRATLTADKRPTLKSRIQWAIKTYGFAGAARRAAMKLPRVGVVRGG